MEQSSQDKTQKAITGFGIIGVFLFFFWLCSGPNKSSGPEVHDDIYAFASSQSFVEQLLKAPSTAEFPFIDAKVRKLGGEHGYETYEIFGQVDAQNSFGAMIRTPFYCKLHYLDKEVICDEVKLLE
jgi:hypothetical protein